MSCIEERVEPDSIVSTDMFGAYNALGVSDFDQPRSDHSRLFAKQGNRINGIENFWNQAKRHLSKFNGIKPEHIYWYLKDCEWRFNESNHNENGHKEPFHTYTHNFLNFLIVRLQIPILGASIITLLYCMPTYP